MSDADSVRAFTERFLQRRTGDDPEDEIDPNVPLPQPDPGMLYGFVGEVAAVAATQTEVNPVATASFNLSLLGAMVGRDVYLPVGNTIHHARIYTLHIGRSGRGGKGDARGLPDRMRGYLEENYPGCLGQTHMGGLSTREGLALLIHDGFKQGKTEIPPIDDKRLFVIENEFANILHQSKRDGNTLSSALRDSWDGISIKPAIKTCRVWASRPHVGLHASITPSELRALIESRDLTNGFANRFLMVWAERVGVVPFPRATPFETMVILAKRLREIIEFAKGDYPMTRDSRPMCLSPEASRLYERIYREELTRPETSDLLTALLERQAPYLLRVAMLFALTDLSLVIREEHITAALAWVRYAKQTVRFVFGDVHDVTQSVRRICDAERIVRFLETRADGASRTDLINECFQKNVAAERIDDAIRALLAAPSSPIAAFSVPRSDGKSGRSRQIYRLKAASDSGDNGDRDALSNAAIGAHVGSYGLSPSEGAETDLSPLPRDDDGHNADLVAPLFPLGSFPESPSRGGIDASSDGGAAAPDSKSSNEIVEGWV